MNNQLWTFTDTSIWMFCMTRVNCRKKKLLAQNRTEKINLLFKDAHAMPKAHAHQGFRQVKIKSFSDILYRSMCQFLLHNNSEQTPAFLQQGYERMRFWKELFKMLVSYIQWEEFFCLSPRTDCSYNTLFSLIFINSSAIFDTFP